MVYEGLSLLAGAMIALMVTANGLLAENVGVWMSLVIIHLCGLIAVSFALLIRRKRVLLRSEGTPWYLYLSGAFGVFTTALNNICFEPLGAAFMLALLVVGQLLGGSLVDHFGLFGMKRYRFRLGKLVGFSLMGVGLLLMTLWQPAREASARSGKLPQLLYALLALATGLNLSFTTATSAALSKRIGVFSSVLMNYLTGLGSALILVVVLRRWVMPSGALHPLLFIGGFLGMLVVTLCNASMMHISVVYVVVLMFVGQLTAGTVVDALTGLPITLPKIAGCLVVAAGVLYNIRQDRLAGTQ